MSDKDAATPRVYLIRHGETEWSRNGRHTGISDIPLLPAGEDRVRQTASVVVGKGRLIDFSKVVRVICSPRQRAMRTMEILLENNPVDTKPETVVTEDIREWGYGDYEGLKPHEIVELRKSRGYDKERKWDIWRDGAEGDGSESPTDVARRLDVVIADIVDIHRRYLTDLKAGDLSKWKGRRDIILVAHGHILRAFVKRWLQFSLETRLYLMLEPGGVCGLSYDHANVEERAVLAGMSYPQSNA